MELCIFLMAALVLLAAALVLFAQHGRFLTGESPECA